MCIAIPMEIVQLSQNCATARALYRGNELEVDTRLVSAKPGDFVLVHAGCAIEIVGEREAGEVEALLRELEELAENGN